MRIQGWLASGMGIIGVVVSNGLASLVWVLRRDLRTRASDLIAVPDGGLEAAIMLSDTVASRLGHLSGRIGDIQAKADQLVHGPAIDEAAAADLATTIDDFINGPYATLRTIYAALRERASAVSDALQGVDRAIPILTTPGVVMERLATIDARLVEIDASMTDLVQGGAAGLSQPGVAAQVSQRAATAQERLDMMAELVTAVGARMQEARDRLAERDHRISSFLTAGAVTGTIMSLFIAGLNVLLYQQGRRWSRRGFTPRP